MRIWLVGLALLASACSTPQFGTGPMAVTTIKELPPPSGSDVIQAPADYLIGPYDKLQVTVFGLQELNAEVVADSGGHISVPMVGDIVVQGKSPAEVAQVIASGLRSGGVRDPQVSVNLKEATSQTFTVDGEVREPGVYRVTSNLSLVRAVASAKGSTEFSQLDDVVVFRTVNGQRMAALYNLGAIRRGNYPDPRIYPNDVVVVGDSPGRRLFRNALTLAPLLTTPLILLLQK